jgi:hypothetical protein
MRCYLFFVALLLTTACSSDSPTKTIEKAIHETLLTDSYLDHHRFFMAYPLLSGDSALFYTDTGGGRIVYPAVAQKMNLSIDSVAVENGYIEMLPVAGAFRERGWPAPLQSPFVFRDSQRMDTSFDGMLGAYWFGDKRWRFGYAEGKLYRVDSIDWRALPALHTVELGFMVDSTGRALTHFPRLDIMVDGDTISTLLDTGAKISLSDDAAAVMSQQGEVAGSFIISTLFDRWRADNPEWRVIEGGDAQLEMDLIEVPEIMVAGHTVGPVWFARRPDRNFTEYMSQWMDQPVQGAVGGSCFKYFESVVVDYVVRKGYFEL